MINKLKTLNHKVWPKKIIHDPKWIVLGVNNVCNLHCKMCDVGTKNLDSTFAQNLVGTHPINMPYELLEKIIDQSAIFFPKSKLAYAFTEPLVYPHLVKSLAYADKKNLTTTLTTNGLTLIHKAADLANAGLNEINISLDGPQDIHNEIRGNKKSFQKALEGVQLLKKYNPKIKVTVICAITEWNIGYLKEFADSFKDIVIDDLALMHTQFTDPKVAYLHNQKWGDMYHATDSNLDIVDFEKMDLELLHEEIRAIKEARYPFKTYFSPDMNSIDELNRYYKRPGEIIGDYCYAAFSSIMIKSDGSVIPAHGRCYNLEIGNVYNNSLKEIWNSSIISKFRSTLMANGGYLPACSRCCSA